MKRPRVLALCLMTLMPLVPVSAQMTHEETVARITYAKLAYVVNIGEIHQAVSNGHDPSLAELENRITGKQLKFQLSNFTSGPVSSIAKQNYADLVTKPEGQDVIDVGLGNYNFMEDVPENREVRETSELLAQASWGPGQNLQANWNVPFEQALAEFDAGSRAVYSRYAAYRVTVSFEGRSRSYNAMFLFGTGTVPVLAVDNVTNSSALTRLIDKSVYPGVLVESPIARKTGVAGWLKAHQVRNPACHGGERQACCDPVSLTCGVAAADISPSFGKPISRKSRRSRTLPVDSPITNAPRLLEISEHIIPPDRVDHVMGAFCVGCCYFNFSKESAKQADSGNAEHVNGAHSWTDLAAGCCQYSGCQGPCLASVAVASSVTIDDNGALISSSICHAKGSNFVNGGGAGSSPTASTNGAAVIVSCSTLNCNCPTAITYNGTNPTFPTGNLWNRNFTWSLNCPARSTTSGTPIIFDTTGGGFHLTSVENGVMFDLAGTGKPIKVSWTDGTSGNAFLALDRNGDGKIDSGKELFGNFTPQPESADPNGFLALAAFDDPANGGNGDGIIDEHDAIWPQLRLWIDENHDGISQPEELYRLPDLGVYSISLKYVQQRHFDQYGNIFRYRGTANPEGQPAGDNVDRKVWDVILVAQP